MRIVSKDLAATHFLIACPLLVARSGAGSALDIYFGANKFGPHLRRAAYIRNVLLKWRFDNDLFSRLLNEPNAMGDYALSSSDIAVTDPSSFTVAGPWI
ncbi:hypothetical protein HD806DRAFT_519056 [Xylariaceae sp. AK1471]|nr:hypothetical protein HD806DRAFT_519056 [Xylariaceae sp. AK1471]